MRKLAIPFLVLGALLMHALPLAAQNATEQRVRTLLKKILVEKEAMDQARDEGKDFDDEKYDSYYNEIVRMDRAALPTVLKIAREHNCPYRYLAFLVLTALFDSHAVPPLLKALKDPDDYIRTMAVLGLHRQSDRQAIPALIKVLKTEENRCIRKYACRALAALEAKKAIDPLMALVYSEGKRKKKLEKENELRGAAMRALGNLKTVKAVGLLLAISYDKNDDDRIYAIIPLANIGCASAAVKLIPLLKEGNLFSQVAVIQAMTQLKHKETVPALVAEMRRSRASDPSFFPWQSGSIQPWLQSPEKGSTSKKSPWVFPTPAKPLVG